MASADRAEYLINAGMCRLAGTLPNGKVVLDVTGTVEKRN